METVKENFKYILVFILFFILVSFFPLTGEDLFFGVGDLNLLKNGFTSFNGKILSNYVAFFLAHIPLLKIMFYVILTIILHILNTNIVNRKNASLMYISIFLFFLTNNIILASSYVSLSWFTYIFIPIIFTLIIMYYVIKDTLYKLNKYTIVILGLVASLFNPVFSILLLLSVGVILLSKKGQDKSLKKLYFGITLGNIVTILSMLMSNLYVIPDVPYNIMNEVIPNIYGINPLITVIFVSLLVYIGIKIYIKNKFIRKSLIFCICIVIIYLFTKLFSSNLTLNYILYELFIVSSYYILFNSTNSIIFKKKIKIYYLFKIVYLIVLPFISQLVPGYMLFIALIDILIILELINYILPTNYLNRTWMMLATILLVSNIYIYSNIYYKYKNMNEYIKNNLECDVSDIKLQLKYETNYLYNYIPKTKEEKNSYLIYYDIKYSDDFIINFNK